MINSFLTYEYCMYSSTRKNEKLSNGLSMMIQKEYFLRGEKMFCGGERSARVSKTKNVIEKCCKRKCENKK